MATLPPALPPPVVRRALAAAGVTAAVLLVGTATGATFGGETATFPTAPKLTATPERLTVAEQPRRGSTPQQDRFLHLIAAAAGGRYPRGTTAELVGAGERVCAMVGAGRPVDDASRTLVIGYRMDLRQARAVGSAAVAVYCPQNRR